MVIPRTLDWRCSLLDFPIQIGRQKAAAQKANSITQTEVGADKID